MTGLRFAGKVLRDSALFSGLVIVLAAGLYVFLTYIADNILR